MNYSKLHIAFMLIIFGTAVYGQTGPPPTFKPITLNPITGVLTGDVPFDQPFAFVGELKDHTVDKVELYILNDVCDINNPNPIYLKVSEWNRTITAAYLKSIEEPDPFALLWAKAGCIDYLQPFRTYSFRLDLFDSLGNKLRSVNFKVVPKSGIANQAKLDFGLAYAFRPKALVAVTTVNFYFTPINDDTDLKNIKGIRSFFLRTSLFAGISPLTLTSNTKAEMKSRYGVGNFVFGIGIRSPFYPALGSGVIARALLQPMRINFGEILYSQVNANPAIPLTKNKLSPYVGITYDLNLASLLGPVGKLVGGL